MPLLMLYLSLAYLHYISSLFVTFPLNLGPAHIPLLQRAFPDCHSPHQSFVSELVLDQDVTVYFFVYQVI